MRVMYNYRVYEIECDEFITVLVVAKGLCWQASLY